MALAVLSVLFLSIHFASGLVCDPFIGVYDPAWLANAEAKEVVVIGGGVSGLSATKTLITNGVQDVVLLEAKDYLGGRVKTHREGSILTEDGAEWINGGNINRLYGLAEQLGALTQPLPDSAYDFSIRTQNGKKGDPYAYDAMTNVYATCEKNNILKKYHGFGYGKCYYDRFDKAYDKSQARKKEKEAWRHYLEMWVDKDTGLTDWDDQSAKDADRFTDWGKDEWNQWADGYDTVVDYLMQDIPDTKVELNTPVCRVFWGTQIDGTSLNGKVLVVTANETSYLVDHVITTVSIGYLKKHHTEMFTPNLKKKYRAALDVMDLGVADKVQIGWDTQWWGTKLLNMQVIFTDSLPAEMEWLEGIMEFFTIHQQPTLIQGFVTGDYARAMEALPEETVKNHLIWHLGNLTKLVVPPSVYFRRTQWGLEEFFEGSYNSYLTLAGDKVLKKRSVLAKPMKRKKKPLLFWGGEHLSNKRYGTVDGAMDTGEEAAFNVIDYMDSVAG